MSASDATGKVQLPEGRASLLDLERWRRYVTKISFRSVLLFSIGYYLSVRLSEHAYGSLSVSSPFWLPSAILLSWFLFTQRKHWPLIAVAVIPIRLAAGAPPGTPLWFLLFSSADDLVTAVFAAWLLLRVLRRPVQLDTFREFTVFLCISAGVAPALSALIAAPARHALGDATLIAAYHWFLGNALAQVAFTPTLLFWYLAVRQHFYPRLKELLVLSAGLTGVSLYAFLTDLGPYSPILLYAPVPFIVWAALRLRPIGTATALSIFSFASMWSAVEGVGLFSRGSPSQNVLSLQLFLLVVSVPLLSLSIILDERRRAEETLRVSEEKFRSIFRDAGVGMVIVSPEGRFLAANQAFCDCLGYTEEELLQKTVQSVTLPEDWPSFSQRLREALEQGTSFQRVEKHCLHKSGRIVTTESSASLIRGLSGEPQYLVGEVLDITQRKLAVEALSGVSGRLIEAHEEERSWIARELHDDFNQRMALLAIMLERVKQQLPATEGAARRGIDEASKRVSELGSDIQALSHRLHSSRLEYLGLVAAVAGFCQEFSDRQNVKIDFHSENIPKGLPKEVSLCLFRVVQEALQNSLKHSGERHFKVSLKCAVNEIELTVHDSGIGFDPEKTISGYGLGLTSMNERLKLVDGELFIDSKPQEGTTIHARVPLGPKAKSAGAVGQV